MTAAYRGAPAVQSVKVCEAPNQKQRKATVSQWKGGVGSDSAAKTPTAPLPSTSRGKFSAFASLIIRPAFKTLLFALQRGEPDLTFAARFPSATIALGAAPLALLGQLCTFMRSVFYFFYFYTSRACLSERLHARAPPAAAECLCVRACVCVLEVAPLSKFELSCGNISLALQSARVTW